MRSVGKRIKEARESMGITQRELAEKLGITAGAVGNYESGTSSPKEPILFAVMKTLGVDANYLFQDELTEEQKRKTAISSLSDAAIKIGISYDKSIPPVQAAARALLSVEEL